MTTKMREVLSKYFNMESKDEKFCYDFSIDSNQEIYINEFAKFISFYSALFYKEDRIVFFNGAELDLGEETIEYIIKLYLYSKNINNKNYLIISEFLFTYLNSIGSKGYRIEFKGNVKEKNRELRSLFNRYGINYPTIKQETVDFYKLIFDELIAGEDNYSYYYLDRSCNNFKSDKSLLSGYIDMLLDKKIHINRLLKYDTDRIKHKEIYELYLDEIIIDDDYSLYFEDYIIELNRYGLLDEEKMDKIIKIITNRINRYIGYSETCEMPFIQLLALVDELKEFLNSLINKIDNLSDNQKKNIKKCIRKLLFVKRNIIKNEEYSTSDLQCISYEQTIKKDKINEFIREIEDNPYKLYKHTQLDFYNEMESAIKMYGDYPIGSIVSAFDIDDKKQIYSKPNDIIYKNGFKELFDEYGKKYTINHPELLNKLSNDYYEEMMKRTRFIFKMSSNIMCDFIKKEKKYDTIVNHLAKEMNIYNDNKFIMTAKSIISTEGIINEILEKKKLHISNKGYENLYTMLYIIKDDKELVNGLMYINYSFYEIGGLNLRNDIAHGALINKNLDIELLICLSCNIFAQWLYKKLIGDENET